MGVGEGDLEADMQTDKWQRGKQRETLSASARTDGRVGEGINVERRHGLQGALMHMGKLAIADILLQ